MPAKTALDNILSSLFGNIPVLVWHKNHPLLDTAPTRIVSLFDQRTTARYKFQRNLNIFIFNYIECKDDFVSKLPSVTIKH